MKRSKFSFLDTSMATAEINDSVQMGLHEWLQLPPRELVEDILNRLQDAKDIAKAQCLCKDFYDAGNNIRSLCVNVLDEYHAWARGDGGNQRRYSQDVQGRNPWDIPFKEQMLCILRRKQDVTQLHVEVETKLQEKHVPEDEKRRTDFWISDPWFLRQWLPGMGHTLQHLSIKDYKQQTMTNPSSIIRILSRSCKLLKTLNLANIYIDIDDCEQLPSMTSLTLSCVRVRGRFHMINDIMPRLQTLAFGVSSVVASNLKVLEPPKVDPTWSNSGLKELKLHHPSIPVIGYLIDKNRTMKKLFWDIPPGILLKDDIPLLVRNFSKLHECGALEVLSIGPGLWRCMEKGVETLASMEKWPSMNHLILHIVQEKVDIIPAMTVLRMLLRPSVKYLTIHVRTSSVVKLDELEPAIAAVVSDRYQHVDLKISTYDLSLDLSCFSF